MAIIKITTGKYPRYRIQFKFKGQKFNKIYAKLEKAQEERINLITEAANNYFMKLNWPYKSVMEIDQMLLFAKPSMRKTLNVMRSYAPESGIYRFSRVEALEKSGLSAVTLLDALCNLSTLKICKVVKIDAQWLVYFPAPNKIKFRIF